MCKYLIYLIVTISFHILFYTAQHVLTLGGNLIDFCLFILFNVLVLKHCLFPK